jgi:MoaA/NifB/PqqE/SkfB family radical SAM enzyme
VSPLLSIAPWVSWRNYATPCSADYRALVSNEKTREYFLLEGPSAEAWIALTAGKGRLPAVDGAGLDGFVSELEEAGLLLADREMACRGSARAVPQAHPPGLDASDDSANFEREMMAWAWQHGFLFSAHLELTYRCNETCVHCYNPGASLLPTDRPNRRRKELDTAEWKHIISQLAEIGVFRLSLSGGEATLRRDFLEIVAHARRLGFAVVIFTNGLRCDNDFVNQLSALWPHSVEVSIYSAVPELHDQVTGVRGSFRKSIDCLRLFHAAGIKTTMKTVLMRTTVGGYADCQALAKSLGAALVMDTNVAPNVDGRRSPVDMNADLDALINLAMAPDSPTSVAHERRAQDRRRNEAVCGAGTKTISISPEGDVSPCMAMPWTVGSARSGKLDELWRTAIARRGDTAPMRCVRAAAMMGERHDLADWQAVTLDDFDECGGHDYCDWCQEICPGDALVLSGNPFAPVEHRCRSALARSTAASMLSGQAAEQALN